MGRYVIGVDFGTLSGRAVLCDAADGRELASAVCPYRSGVMEKALPDGTPLGLDWAVQDPMDYMHALTETIRAVVRDAGVPREEIVGIGTDVTAATVMPVLRDGTPLCTLAHYANRPHAYLKLWKHHAAQAEADQMTSVAVQRGEGWLEGCGGRLSSEMGLPKLWQVLREAPDIYDAMDDWIEMSDWLVWQMTGKRAQGMCSVGYKRQYRKGIGFPDEAYFAALDERLRHVVQEKLSAPVLPVCSRAGELTKEMAERLGLTPGIAVSSGLIDAHVCVLSAGIDRPGQMLGILGTSACYMMLAKKKKPVPGIFGVVEDGILPGYFGYEAGQSSVGDLFGWMTDRFVPAAYVREAEAQGMNIHQHLTQLAARLAPGESGLLALDWWNGCRSPLLESRVSGMLLGMTLSTRPEEIYRALIESTAYGARVIVENYRRHGVPVDAFIVTGGIGRKNPLAMQIFADVLGMDVSVIASSQGGAQGSAILGAYAAGLYPDIESAIRAMAVQVETTYKPDPEHAKVYDGLYAEYHRLVDYFGRGGNDIMKQLHAIKAQTK